MQIEGIDVFVEVVDAQSFTRAARRLGIPTTTVSAKIARLEERLGVTLIQRTTRQLHVTPIGRAYYVRCVRALAELAEAEQELAAVVQEPSGVLRISAPPDLAQALLPPLVERFLKTYPKTSVELIITNTKLDLIAANVDLAVRVGRFDDSSLIVRKFRSVRVALWASEDYLAAHGTPTTPEDLARHVFVRFSPVGLRLKLKSSTGEAFDLPFSSRLASDDLNNIRTFIMRGNGIGLLPEVAGNDTMVSAPLVRVLPDFDSEAGSVCFAYPAQRFVPQTVRAFISMATGEQK